MGWGLWLLLASVAVALDVGPAATWPVAPTLALGLAGWVWVRGTERSVLWRLGLLGLLLDAADPGSEWFFAGALPLVAAGLHPLRTLLVRHTLISWLIGSSVFVLAVRLCDGAGHLAGGWLPALAGLTLSLWLVVPVAWALEWLPRRYHPAGG